MKIKVFEILSVWFVKSKNGYVMPLIDFYKWKAKKGNNFMSKYYISFIFDMKFQQ
tara:strand:+ start:25 stop:189 length:165 start_codon:yes stop_codon:yes gene_type:complete